MPTMKRRINITVDDGLYRSLGRLSRRKKKSVSGVTLQLIEIAIALEEDRYFSEVGDERLSKNEKRVAHSKAWDE